MLNEQRVRAFLFYLSVVIFFTGLPFILSFSLGYKFNRRTFKFTKTGIISLKTQPSGASIYLNDKLLAEKTPATLNELLPDNYDLKVELEKHYPWLGEVKVEAGRVVRLEKIILFPIRPHVGQINKEKISSFWVDEEKGVIYFININKEEHAVYKSDLDGDNYEKIGDFLAITPAPLKFVLSGDKKKIVYFNRNQVGLVYLEPQADRCALAQIILVHSEEPLVNVFWHSDNYHLILVTEKSIQAFEIKEGAIPVKLVSLNKKNTSSFYDVHNDNLYFLDSQKAADGNLYDNLYKLELNPKNFPFTKEWMKINNE